jgi:hypothetical protein
LSEVLVHRTLERILNCHKFKEGNDERELHRLKGAAPAG